MEDNKHLKVAVMDNVNKRVKWMYKQVLTNNKLDMAQKSSTGMSNRASGILWENSAMTGTESFQVSFFIFYKNNSQASAMRLYLISNRILPFLQKQEDSLQLRAMMLHILRLKELIMHSKWCVSGVCRVHADPQQQEKQQKRDENAYSAAPSISCITIGSFFQQQIDNLGMAFTGSHMQSRAIIKVSNIHINTISDQSPNAILIPSASKKQ